MVDAETEADIADSISDNSAKPIAVTAMSFSGVSLAWNIASLVISILKKRAV